MAIKFRRAQAMIELAFGMFALTLVVSLLVIFALYIKKSLAQQNDHRADPPPFKLKLQTE